MLCTSLALLGIRLNHQTRNSLYCPISCLMPVVRCIPLILFLLLLVSFHLQHILHPRPTVFSVTSSLLPLCYHLILSHYSPFHTSSSVHLFVLLIFANFLSFPLLPRRLHIIFHSFHLTHKQEVRVAGEGWKQGKIKEKCRVGRRK